MFAITPKHDIIIISDEAHRTQNGLLAENMANILPTAAKIGFTGTPLMKTEKNILLAFILNLSFSVFEFIGGTITNSVSIISDSIHDIGDALSIGISYILEHKSRKRPNQEYTYGYNVDAINKNIHDYYYKITSDLFFF